VETDSTANQHSKWPSVRLADAFLNQGAMDQFKEAVKMLGLRLKSPKAT